MVRSVVMALGFVVLPLVAAAWVWFRLRAAGSTSPLMRWLYAGSIAAGGLTLMVITFTLAMGVNLDWNAAKLAPIVAMVRAEPTGEPLYQDPNTGVMTAWIYGPVPALIFLPAAMFSRPTPVIVTGIVINILCALGPVLWAHLRVSGNNGRGSTRAQHTKTPAQAILEPSRPPPLAPRPFAFLMFGVFIWVSLLHESLRRAIYIVGPDGPAIGLAVMSIVFLFGKRTNVQIALSALCAVLSCWSKQTMIPFVLAAPIYLFIVDRRAAVRYLIALAGIGLVVSIVFFVAFSPREAWFTRRWLHNMWFHMVTIPRHHPWQEMVSQPGASKTMSVWRAFAEMLEDSTEMIVVLLAVLLILLVGGAFRVANRKAWITENPWVMFILAGVLLVPSAIVGFVKVGGYVNNFALFSFMITIAATTALCANFARIEVPALREFARALACGMIIMRAMQVGVARGNFAIMWDRIRNVDVNQQEQVYDFAMAHPGIVFFPWNNLSTLLAEKRLYHFEWGIVDRFYTPYPWTPEQVRTHIPPQARALAFGPMTQSFNSAQLFPNATAVVPAREDLPGFVIVAEPGTTLPPPKNSTSIPAKNPVEKSK